MWVFPLAAALTALAFAGLVTKEFIARRRPYLLAWAIALFMFAAASAAAFLGILSGWNTRLFAIYWLFGAVLNVPFLAAGEVLLLFRAKAVEVGVLLVMVFITGFAFPNSDRSVSRVSARRLANSRTSTPREHGCSRQSLRRSRAAPGPAACSRDRRRRPRLRATLGRSVFAIPAFARRRARPQSPWVPRGRHDFRAAARWTLGDGSLSFSVPRMLSQAGSIFLTSAGVFQPAILRVNMW